MKIMSVVGARPQFVKLSMLCRAFGGDVMTCEHVLVHTGQHYDFEMSSVFFDQLEIPAPDYHLEIGSGSHGDQTGRMLAAVEGVLVKERPGVVLVFGDTNTTLAAALAAAKMGIPIGHVEAGMRSFNRHMPEEINRVVTDHLATMHFCATETAVENLKNEGVMRGVYLVGDVMQEAVLLYKERARLCSNALEKVGLGGMDRKRYALATIHRAENTDDEKRLQGIIEALIEISRNVRVLLPLHPRTRKALSRSGMMLFLEGAANVMMMEPLSYIDMLALEQSASFIMTDSGGVQKEAFWLNVPCITLRDETEWVETVQLGMNQVVGAQKQKILEAVSELALRKDGFASPRVAEHGHPSRAIVDVLLAGMKHGA